MCALSGIEQHQSVIYHPSSNGRAEAAVKAVAMALRKFLSQRSGKWVQALPLAVWGLNDLPGLIAPYPPHRIILGGIQWALGMCRRSCWGMGRKTPFNVFSGWLLSAKRSVTV